MNPSKPYGGKSIRRLESLINQDNHVTLVHGQDYLISLPEPIATEDGRNTLSHFIPIGPYFDRPIQFIRYWRQNLDILEILPEGWVAPVLIEHYPTTTHALLPAINQAFRLDLEPEEVMDLEITEDPITHQVVIDERKSFAWIGQMAFSVRSPGEPVALATVLPVNRLMGLVYTPPW